MGLLNASFPGYTVGENAYGQIEAYCSPYGKRAAASPDLKNMPYEISPRRLKDTLKML